MSARILTGNEPADALLGSLKERVRACNPTLVIVQVGNDPASSSYIRKKMESCKSIGMDCDHRHLSANISFEDLAETIASLNGDSSVTGFILQLPLPEGLWSRQPEIMRLIDPRKDVDGFTAYNIGKTFLSKAFEHLPPATPSGIITLLEYYDIPIAGQHAVIVGRSNIVGKPLGIMLLNRDATVTICHSKTTHLREICSSADILVSAVGQKHLITTDMVKRGSVVIDVGMVRADGELTGDVDFAAVKEIASAISPVPGGVGPMTVASLLRNCVLAKERQMKEPSHGEGSPKYFEP